MTCTFPRPRPTVHQIPAFSMPHAPPLILPFLQVFKTVAVTLNCKNRNPEQNITPNEHNTKTEPQSTPYQPSKTVQQ